MTYNETISVTSDYYIFIMSGEYTYTENPLTNSIDFTVTSTVTLSRNSLAPASTDIPMTFYFYVEDTNQKTNIMAKRVNIRKGETQNLGTFNGNFPLQKNGLSAGSVKLYVAASSDSNFLEDIGEFRFTDLLNKISGNWEYVFPWKKVNGAWKRCIAWKKVNGAWKKGI